MKIYLIGFMGSGKTTVAQELSKKLSLPVVDMDHVIELQEAMVIPEIFQKHGEEYFRKIETDLLRGVDHHTIVSTGGGIILKEENRKLLKKGTVIYLEADWDTIVNRLHHDQNRPLWKGDESEKKSRFLQRLPLYKDVAEYCVSVDGKTPSEIADAIVECLKGP